MATYVIVREAPRMQNWNLHPLGIVARLSSNPSLTYNDREYNEPGDEHQHHYMFIEATTQERAEEAAIAFASKVPGARYFVAEVKTAFVAPPSSPVKMSVTDKGILPV